MIEDAELLHRYATDRSESAFTELVRRRIDLVYAVALRQVGGDAHLAEDVTQRVFADLAKKASELSRRVVLSGWLCRSAQFAAADVVRAERRRRAREEKAETMKENLPTADASMDWEKFRPLLDQAMGELDDDDRDAVALRFFEERSFAEIGAKLKLTEEASRKRVARALDRMQALLARRGITSTAAAVGVALASHVGVAAPAGLAASVAGAALTGATTTAVSWLTFMSMTKLQLGIAAVFAAALTTGYFVQARTNENLRAEIATQRTDESASTALRAENQRLASAVAEVEMLRRDDLEFQQLAQRAGEMKKTIDENAEKARIAAATLAEAPTISRISVDVRYELERLTKELSALGKEYKALNEKANDPGLSEEARARTQDALALKGEAYKQKSGALNALIQGAQARGELPPPSPGKILQIQQEVRGSAHP